MIAEINNIIERAIEHEVADGPTESVQAKAEVKHQKLWGFHVPDEVLLSEAKTVQRIGRRKQIDIYRDDAAKLRTRLGSIDIEPMAIITAKVWEEIVRRSGLVVATIDNRAGAISVSTYLVKKIREASTLRLGWIMHTAFFVGLIAAVNAGYLFSRQSWETAGIIGAIVFVGVLLIIGSCVIGGIIADKIERGSFRRQVEKYIATHSWAQFIREVSRDGWLLSTRGGDCVWLEPTFPAPSPSAVINLRKLSSFDQRDHQMELHVAAVPEAISLRGGMRRYFNEGFDAVLRQDLKYDPILYVQNGNAVAIIDQWGDFPIELKVVEEVAQSEHLL